VRRIGNAKENAFGWAISPVVTVIDEASNDTAAIVAEE
jgi:hypothetical protein